MFDWFDKFFSGVQTLYDKHFWAIFGIAGAVYVACSWIWGG